MGEGCVMKSKEIYIEERPDGTFAVLKRNAQRASGLFDTQREAIRRAKELVPGVHPDIERVRATPYGNSPQWRSGTKKSR
jgi:uncharacterized protein YdaT